MQDKLDGMFVHFMIKNLNTKQKKWKEDYQEDWLLVVGIKVN